MWKEQKETHGKIQGTIEGKQTIGTVYKNTPYGIYGNLSNPYALSSNLNKSIPIALKSEIKLGKAKLISTVENGEPKEYDIEIEKIYTNNTLDNKNMVIKITDSDLLDKTGGILQGMSGSPIIQDGKLVRCSYSCYDKWFKFSVMQFLQKQWLNKCRRLNKINNKNKL